MCCLPCFRLHPTFWLFAFSVSFSAFWKITSVLQFRGEAERVAQAALAAQREFEYRKKEIEVMRSIASNPQNIITGEAENNDIAKVCFLCSARF